MGSLSGTTAVLTTGINLSVPPQTDWSQYPQSWTPNRKAGGGSTITVPTLLGGATQGVYNDDANGVSWNDGTPTATGTNSSDGIYAESSNAAVVGMGYTFTFPADTTSRKAIIPWAVFFGTATITAQLSDSSAAEYSDTPTGTVSEDVVDYLTTLTYSANSPGQTLTITVVLSTVAGADANTGLRSAQYLDLPTPTTGTWASTLANSTVAAVGTEIFSGSVALTTANATVAVVAKQTFSGALSSTLANATVAATGTETFSGSLAATLANATVAAVGSVTAATNTGTWASTLGNAICSVAAQQTFGGLLASTLANATVAVAGGETFSGALTSTLANATVVAAGGETFSGSLASTLANATVAAVGAEVFSGSLASTLDNATVAASGTTFAVSGTWNSTLADATCDIEASVPDTGNAGEGGYYITHLRRTLQR